MGIVWIASYPKSGNTWVRFLVHHLLYGPPASSASVNERIPPILKDRTFPVPAGGRVCSKTHFVFGPAHPRAEETEAAIVVVRNPRDVALSALNYRRLAGVLPPGVTDAAFLRGFIEHRGDPGFALQGFGAWAENVASWTAALPFPTLVLRYEQLKADAAGAARSVAAHMGIDADDGVIAAAVEASRLESLRAMEVRERDAGDPGTIFRGRAGGRYFMNTGAVGQRLDEVEPGLDAAFDAAFGADAERFGYGRGA